MAETGPERALTKRQAKFVRFMAMDDCKTPTEAARRAGYSEAYSVREGYRLANNPRVAREVEAEKESKQRWVDMEDAELIGRVAEACRAEAGPNQLRALELMSKIKGLQRDVQKVEHSYADDMEQLNRQIREAEGDPIPLRVVN
jgi:phage terminase small subunit